MILDGSGKSCYSCKHGQRVNHNTILCGKVNVTCNDMSEYERKETGIGVGYGGGGWAGGINNGLGSPVEYDTSAVSRIIHLLATGNGICPRNFGLREPSFVCGKTKNACSKCWQEALSRPPRRKAHP